MTAAVDTNLERVRAMVAASPRDEVKGYLLALECLVPEANAYLSVPVTGGALFVQWYATLGRQLSGREYVEEQTRRVIHPNMRRACALADELISTSGTGMRLLNPAPLFVENWTQDQYPNLWAATIRRFARTVFFADDWHLSSGCSVEYIVALEAGIPRHSMAGDRIDVMSAIELLSQGVDQYAEIGRSAELLSGSIAYLKRKVRADHAR